jgi:hypothetical protein
LIDAWRVISRLSSVFKIKKFVVVSINIFLYFIKVSLAKRKQLASLAIKNVLNSIKSLAVFPDVFLIDLQSFRIFFSVIVLIMIASTVYEVVMEARKDKPNPFLSAFSVYTNGEKLFEIKRSSSPNSIECLHGIRGVAILWIILGHRYVLPTVFLPVINRNDRVDWLETMFSAFVTSSQFAVDAFFIMAGLLVTWSFFGLMEKNGKVNLAKFYLHRYLRVTPVLLVMVLFMVSLYRHLGDGPFHKRALWFNLEHCETNWWTTFLHIQNYYNPTALVSPKEV